MKKAELGKFDKNVKQLYDIRESWCYLLKNSYKMNDTEYKSLENKGEDMAKAVKHLLNLSQDEALQEYIDAFDKRERDRISAENLARREGQQEGIEKGIEKGRQEGIAEVILKFLNTGMSAEEVSKVTGFSREEICKFQERSK